MCEGVTRATCGKVCMREGCDMGMGCNESKERGCDVWECGCVGR